MVCFNGKVHLCTVYQLLWIVQEDKVSKIKPIFHHEVFSSQTGKPRDSSKIKVLTEETVKTSGFLWKIEREWFRNTAGKIKKGLYSD